MSTTVTNKCVNRVCQVGITCYLRAPGPIAVLGSRNAASCEPLRSRSSVEDVGTTKSNSSGENQYRASLSDVSITYSGVL